MHVGLWRIPLHQLRVCKECLPIITALLIDTEGVHVALLFALHQVRFKPVFLEVAGQTLILLLQSPHVFTHELGVHLEVFEATWIFQRLQSFETHSILFSSLVDRAVTTNHAHAISFGRHANALGS